MKNPTTSESVPKLRCSKLGGSQSMNWIKFTFSCKTTNVSSCLKRQKVNVGLPGSTISNAHFFSNSLPHFLAFYHTPPRAGALRFQSRFGRSLWIIFVNNARIKQSLKEPTWIRNLLKEGMLRMAWVISVRPRLLCRRKAQLVCIDYPLRNLREALNPRRSKCDCLTILRKKPATLGRCAKSKRAMISSCLAAKQSISYHQAQFCQTATR